MARKNLLVDLIDEKLTAVNSADEQSMPSFSGRGAVGAMSRSLERLSAEVEAAKSIGVALQAGNAVVDIDAALIEASFVADRFAETKVDEGLLQSLKEHGQQVPVLLRPHPEQPGRYQVAYGHRRVRALRALGRSVRAIVKGLSDDELVIAQGQENSVRRDLSFIEKASFAAALESRGFTRDVTMAALGIDKTELSRLISTRRAVPDHVVNAIGAAPATGRRRWMDLADALQHQTRATVVDAAIRSAAFEAADSDARFNMVLAAAQPIATKPEPVIWRTAAGRDIAEIKMGASRSVLTIDEKAAPEFAAFIVAEMPSLYASYQARKTPRNTN